MRYSKAARGFLINRYAKILQNCFLLNLGWLMVTPTAQAAVTVNNFDDLQTALQASDADVVFELNGQGLTQTGADTVKVSQGQQVIFQNIGSADEGWSNTNRLIDNDGTIGVDKVYFSGSNIVEMSNRFVGGIIRNRDANILYIRNSEFSDNQVSTGGSAPSLWGGLIHNGQDESMSTAVIGEIKNVVFDNNYVYSKNAAPHGAMIENFGKIGSIDGATFSNNTMTSAANQFGGAHGVGLDNNQYGEIGKITNSVFYNNKTYRTGEQTTTGNYHASGGAMSNYHRIDEISNTLFELNQAESVASATNGGAIMNVYNGVGMDGYIDKIVDSRFINNHIYSKNARAHGGALDSGNGLLDDKHALIETIANVLFQGNYAQSEKATAAGGAVYNSGEIKLVSGDFNNNFAKSEKATADGGAVFNRGEIKLVSGDFNNNFAKSDNGQANGGAVFNNGEIGAISGAFQCNYTQSETNAASGGVITNLNKIDLISGDFNNNFAQSVNNIAWGGTVYNEKEIDAISGTFQGNYAKSENATAGGGAVFNSGEIKFVSGDFNNNFAKSENATAIGGVILNHKNSTINDISGHFENNYAYSQTGMTSGGVIATSYDPSTYEGATFKRVEGMFINNRAVSGGRATAGAIDNNGYARIEEYVKGSFIGNYAQSTGGNAQARGGAMMNFGYIKLLEADFVDNYAETNGTSAIGGALVNNFDNTGSLGIAELSGTYRNNHATSTGTNATSFAQGGAIYNTSTLTIKDADFVGNYVEGPDAQTQGGAIWNSKNLTFIGTVNFADNYELVGGVKQGNDITNSGALTLAQNSVVTIGSGIRNSGTVTLQNGSTLNLNAYLSGGTIKFENGSILALQVNKLDDEGYVKAANLSIEDGAKLRASLAQGVTVDEGGAEVRIFAADNADFVNNMQDEFANNMYQFSKINGAEGVYKIKQISSAGDVVKDNGGDANISGAANAWVGGDNFGSDQTGQEIADQLADMAQNNGQDLVETLEALAPSSLPEVQLISQKLSHNLFGIVDRRLQNSAAGLASGDVVAEVSPWIKTYWDKSEFDGKHDYDVDGKGVVIGVDARLNQTSKIGVGYSYDSSDAESTNRESDIATNTVFAYGEYRPNAWFVNGIAGYGVSDYEEKKYALGKKYAADYDVKTWSLQTQGGYEYQVGGAQITPEIGARYLRVNREKYTDTAGQTVSSLDMVVLTAQGGVSVVKKIKTGKAVISPKAYVGVSYDVVSDDETAAVSLSNGSQYLIESEEMDRFAVNFGAGVTAQIGTAWEAYLNYRGQYRNDYTDHYASVGLQYHF